MKILTLFSKSLMLGSFTSQFALTKRTFETTKLHIEKEEQKAEQTPSPSFLQPLVLGTLVRLFLFLTFRTGLNRISANVYGLPIGC
jgi:hypothetical protein